MRQLRLFAPALVCAAVIWIVGGLDSASAPRMGLGLDKVAHFTMYGVLGFLLGRAWSAAGRGRTWVVPLLLALLLGVADERRQAGLPSRSAELADWLADAAGATLGFAAAVTLARRRKQIEIDERE